MNQAQKTTLTARTVALDDTFGRFLGYMPNPDEVLGDAGEAVDVFRSMKSDPRIKSLLKVAKSAILGFGASLEQGDASDQAMETCRKALKNVPLYSLQKRLLSAIEYGYAVVELVWALKEGLWLPSEAILRKPERFRFTSEGRLKGLSSGTSLDLYEQDYKWLVYRNDKDAENPYGTSVLSSCYWAWKFKKAGMEFWLMAAEKFAVPSLLAIFESTSAPDEARKRAADLSEMLSSVQSGSGGAVANIKDIKVVEAADKISEFKTLMDWCDTQIAYGIVYQSLTSQEAQNGTRAQAEVHEDTFLLASKEQCRELIPVLQRYVDWIVTLNYGPDAVSPTVTFDLEDKASWQQIIDAIDRGVPVSRKALYGRFRLPEPLDHDDSYIAGKSASQEVPPKGTGNTSPSAVDVENPPTNIQATALNGAQVTSLVDLANQVAQGALPAASARAIAQASFPLVKGGELDAIFNPLSSFKPSLLADSEKKKTITIR